MNKEDFKKLYENHTAREVAEMLKIGTATVTRYAKALGISKELGRPKKLKFEDE